MTAKGRFKSINVEQWRPSHTQYTYVVDDNPQFNVNIGPHPNTVSVTSRRTPSLEEFLGEYPPLLNLPFWQRRKGGSFDLMYSVIHGESLIEDLTPENLTVLLEHKDEIRMVSIHNKRTHVYGRFMDTENKHNVGADVHKDVIKKDDYLDSTLRLVLGPKYNNREILNYTSNFIKSLT